MAQSLACLHVHLVFSTKERFPFIAEVIREPLHAYLAVVLQDLKCPAILINSVADHVHILFELAHTRTMSEVVEKLKTASSKWMNAREPLPIVLMARWLRGICRLRIDGRYGARLHSPTGRTSSQGHLALGYLEVAPLALASQSGPLAQSLGSSIAENDRPLATPPPPTTPRDPTASATDRR
jgi:REP element-mobilizing transposase RayT